MPPWSKSVEKDFLILTMHTKFNFSLLPDTYVYAQQTTLACMPLMMFDGQEGKTYILRKNEAVEQGILFKYPCRCIQLVTKTALNQVGITASIARLLADENISCNVVAAYHHDYFFVSQDKAEIALTVLQSNFKVH